MKNRSARARLFVWAAAVMLLAPGWTSALPAPGEPRAGAGAGTAEIGVMERARVEAPRYVEGRIVVRYRGGAAKRLEERAAVRASVDGALVRSFESFPDLEALALPAGLSVESAVAALGADSRVQYAEPDYVYTTQGVPNDQYFAEQWGLDNTGQEINDYPSAGPGIDIDAPEAWEMGTGNTQVVVAMTDEGIDVNHPDLAPNMWTNPGEIPGNDADDDQNGFIDDVYGWDFFNDDATVFDGARDTSNQTDFHGTHTSGTVGAVGNNGQGVAGVCWNVRLMSTKFLEGGGATSNAISCIDYILAMKQRGVNVRAINASWGGGAYSAALYEAICAAGEAGILFCAASGNGGGNNVGDDNDRYPAYPASYDLPNIISVGAWTRYNQPALYSNYGRTTVDLLAPGSIIASTGPNGRYYYSSGTSMAAPHVTGAVTLIASLAPSLTAAQIKDVIMGTVQPVPTAICVTGGRLDLRAALAAALALGGDPGGGDPGGGDPGGGEPEFPPPVISSVRYFGARKVLVVYGTNLYQDKTVIEVDGIELPITGYPFRYQLPNGTWAALEGRALGRIATFLPKGQAVQVTLYDRETELRSEPVSFTR
jgi:serine protease